MSLASTQTLNRKEYKGYLLGGKDGRCVGLTNLPPSCVDCLEIWEPQPPGTFMVPTEMPFMRSNRIRAPPSINLNCFF